MNTLTHAPAALSLERLRAKMDRSGSRFPRRSGEPRRFALVFALLLVIATTTAAQAGPAPPYPPYPPPPPRVYAPPPRYYPAPPPPPPLSPAMRVLYAPFYAAGLVLRYGVYYAFVAPIEVFSRVVTYGAEGGVEPPPRRDLR